MYAMSLATLAFLVLGAQAAPAKRDAALDVPGVGTITISGLPAGATPGPDEAISFMQANSDSLLSELGTTTFFEAEAAFVMAQATTLVPPTETQLSVFLARVETVPVVQVSSIGGPGITLATGTASGIVTELAGHTFTAAPKKNHAPTGLRVPSTLVAGAATILGSMVVGAIVVL
ncbi:hypothetical protein C8Q78DRAFT_1152025 [Trametes maxima]|nr:hypothetical protein C8Q78DRAFT_1152025 [Trametes maxima]